MTSVCFALGTPLVAAGTAMSARVWDTGTWNLIAELQTEGVFELAIGPVFAN